MAGRGAAHTGNLARSPRKFFRVSLHLVVKKIGKSRKNFYSWKLRLKLNEQPQTFYPMTHIFKKKVITILSASDQPHRLIKQLMSFCELAL